MNSVNTGTNKFCGPAAISIITRMTTDEAEKAIQAVRSNNRPVTGAWLRELAIVLGNKGKETRYVHTLEGQSLFFSLNQMASYHTLYKQGYYIIATATHFFVIQKDENDKFNFCDNHTKKPINAAMSARLTQRVIQVLYVW